MKHAGPDALDRLEPLLTALRPLPGMVERKRGVFYRRSKAYLHFHEDPKGLFADLRDAAGIDFERYEVSGVQSQAALVALVEARLRA